MTVIGPGVLPARCREKIARDIGANMPSKTSGDSIGVSRPLKKRVFDATDCGVEDTRTPGVR